MLALGDVCCGFVVAASRVFRWCGPLATEGKRRESLPARFARVDGEKKHRLLGFNRRTKEGHLAEHQRPVTGKGDP